MAVTVSTVLGPRWMTSNGRKTVCSSDQTRSDQTRSPQPPVEITPGIGEEVSPRVCRGVFPMFQSRSSVRSWKLEARPDTQKATAGGE